VSSRSTTAGHDDPGLQPERTILSWTRTLAALVTVSLLFVRWYTREGVVTLVPAVVAVMTASAIHLTQRRRYRRTVDGIIFERVRDAAGPVLATAAICAVLGVAGMWVLVFGRAI
jgi:hypothetical protein